MLWLKRRFNDQTCGIRVQMKACRNSAQLIQLNKYMYAHTCNVSIFIGAWKMSVLVVSGILVGGGWEGGLDFRHVDYYPLEKSRFFEMIILLTLQKNI